MTIILSQDGATPLHIASQNGHSDIVTILIKSGANINMAMNVSDYILTKLDNNNIVYIISCSKYCTLSLTGWYNTSVHSQ